MQEMNYRFNVWDAVGRPLRTFTKDESFVLSAGLRLQVTPEGDAREGSFRAKGSGILVPSLSAVQIEYKDSQFWRPIFYGQVRQGGNPRDTDGENYILRSLGLKLQAVTLSAGFVAPKQPAHLTVRAIIQDVITSGQLGNPSLINYTGGVFDTIPDLPFDCREIKASNQQIAGALLDQIVQDAAGLGVDVRWGVGPDREFYFREANGAYRVLDNEDLSYATWKAPVAETPCTVVLWHVAQKPDGGWLYHESVSAAADEIGVWVLPRTLTANVNPWQALDAQYTAYAQSGGNMTPVSPQPTINGAGLQDGLTGSGTGQEITVPGEVTQLRASLTAPPQRVTISGKSIEFLPGGGTNLSVVALNSAGAVVDSVPVPQGNGWEPTAITATVNFENPLNAQAFAIYPGIVPGGTTGAKYTLSELAFYRLDTELLDRLAKFYYQTPAKEPAEIPARVFGRPQDLEGRVEWGDYARAIEVWEYRISAARGLEKVAFTGQADDPNKLAQAALIKANDGKAVITAVTASR